MEYRYCYKTMIGLLWFSEEAGELSGCELIAEGPCLQKETPLIKKAFHQVVEYLNGEREQFTLPLKITGTAFERKVYATLLNIGYGKTTHYQALAEAINRPKSYRAVGNALGKNRLLLFIPCHRVIAKDNAIGGFTGGLEKKKALLRLEKAITGAENEKIIQKTSF